MGRLEAERDGGVATRSAALLSINVIAKVVLALVFNNALNAVGVVDVVVDTRGKRLAIGVGGAREGQTGR